MLLATFVIDYPILQETLAESPADLEWVQSDLTEDGSHQMLVWIETDDFESLETRLENDPTVTGTSRMTSLDRRRLYRIELTESGHRSSVYPIVVDRGIVLERVTANRDGWSFRVSFPEYDALEEFRTFCARRDIEIELERLYERREGTTRSEYGTTERQRELLEAAVETGYLDVPRACTLAELGEELGISSNAASERFRRGASTLIENTLLADSD
ncbi:hypothetical protein SAMN05444422_11083 [Halobiforma haloterrestris]|uniref:GAF and HTH_10 associated domain-containing protein n=1 Tax=Natronobacterium haloterrestre TaxID=148448 RepID=A0A1I1K516_NATHA|nr:helix-turn-helix domain-containing protein [Halobiforma haloterrestris]SFC55332.1 hypothetical protein SAMN05444422_11083 [Halobiforma haloterrestris]